jgi:hypothetical protein
MMMQGSWYHRKADECSHLALVSTDEVTRAGHQRDSDNWERIALRIDVAEDAAASPRSISSTWD